MFISVPKDQTKRKQWWMSARATSQCWNTHVNAVKTILMYLRGAYTLVFQNCCSELIFSHNGRGSFIIFLAKSESNSFIARFDQALSRAIGY